MEPIWLYVFSETVPNWLMALSAAAAFATFVWRRHDKREERALRVEDLGEKVHARWIIRRSPDSEKDEWGLLITNGLETPVRDISIECQGNRYSSTYLHRQVAPGQHFAQSLPTRQQPWGWAEPIASAEIRDNVTPGNHDVLRMWFTARGRQYVRDADGTVRLVETDV